MQYHARKRIATNSHFPADNIGALAATSVVAYHQMVFDKG